MQSALSYYGLIPEGVTTIVSVTTGQPGLFETPLVRYQFHHVKSNFFKGFHLTEKLQSYAESPKLQRAMKFLLRIRAEEIERFEEL